MSDIGNIEDFQLDVLKEIGNIGSGNATTALSQLLDKPVNMSVPSVRILSFAQVAEVFGGAEQVVIGIYLRVEGEAAGNMFFILTRHHAKKLLRNLVGLNANDEAEFSDMDISALSEIGNILVGSYLTSLCNFTNLKMIPTVPALSIDMAGAILSYGLLQFGKLGEQALLIDTMFLDGEHEIEGHFFLIPDPDSIDSIFNALGVPL